MKITEIKTIRLDADEGKILTNGTVYVTPVFLGVNESVDNWHEITLEEYEVIKQEQEEETENAESDINGG